MRRLLKGLIGFILTLVPLLVLAVGAGALWLSRSLPPASGTMTVAAVGAPVSIERDANGVPHILARSRFDAFSGLGLAHAQDRLWQMEVARMAGQGRLSEIFGEATIETDVWLRTIAMHEAAERSYQTFPDEAKRALEAYAAGVNAWIERDSRVFSSRLPPEFVILGHEPEPWRPVDSVIVVKMMSVGLASNIGDEIDRLAFARAGFSAAEMEDLLPPAEGVDAPPLPDLRGLLGLETGEMANIETDAFGAIASAWLTGRGASNNWVVSGERTETGSPILANDPHLGLSAPAIWYLAHLRVENGEGANRNMVGATLAGAPLVLLGRNDDIAWGFTNTGADVQDLFVERVDPQNPDRYITPDGSQPFGSARETIAVSGGEAHEFTRRWTRHGPVMPAGYRNLDRLLPDDTVGALAWTALAGDDHTVVAGLNVWDFASVADFQEGMRPFVSPMQSMVVADRGGNIGLIAPGRVPVRDARNRVMGRAPVPGWEARYDWQATIPYDELPRLTNPRVGAIGTANSRIVDDTYEPLITLDWDEPFRQQRVEELVIEAKAPHGMDTSREAQADVYSTAFASLMPTMIQAVEGRDDVDRFAIAALDEWDHRMTADSPEPLIAMAWMREAMRTIFADDLGAAFDPWFQNRAQALQRVLSGRANRTWCAAGERRCGEELAEALQAALALLRERYGTDMNAWRWGAAHAAINEHRPFGRVRFLDRIFNIEVESPGGPYTLNRGRTDLADNEAPFANRHAASFRGIYDLADLDRSTYVIPTGQSGNVFSRHYRDLAQAWREVEGIVIETDPATYRSKVSGVWQMVP